MDDEAIVITLNELKEALKDTFKGEELLEAANRVSVSIEELKTGLQESRTEVVVLTSSVAEMSAYSDSIANDMHFVMLLVVGFFVFGIAKALYRFISSTIGGF